MTSNFAGVDPAHMRARLQSAPKSITLGELRRLNLPPRRHLLGPWLRTGESAMVWAPTGVGKSWFALSCALAVAGGGAVLGWQAKEPARVLYVDGEMHTEELQERMNYLADHEAIAKLDITKADQNLVFDARQHQELDRQFWDLLLDNDQAALVEKVKKGGFDLVILDNFTVLSDSLADENSAGSMKPALRLMLALKQADVATVLVHHSNKSGESYRGSTAIAATFEVILGLQHAPDPRADRRNSAGFALKIEKFRGRKDDTMEERKAFLVGGQWLVEDIEDREARMVAEAYRTLQFTSQGAIAGALGIAQYAVSRALKRAVALNMITEKEARECVQKARELTSGDAMIVEADTAEQTANLDF